MNRLKYAAQRLLMGVPVVLFGLTVTFLILYLGPLDPIRAILGKDATPTAVRNLKVSLGFVNPDGTKVPLWNQYIDFMIDTLTFNFGESWVIAQNQSVTSLIMNRAPATLWLGFWSVVIALVVGIPLGIYAGLNSNSIGDYVASAGGISWRAMPNFWLAVLFTGVLSAGGLLSFYPDLGSSVGLETTVIGTSEALGNLANGVDPFDGIPILGYLWIPIPDPIPILQATKWVLPAALVLGSSSMGNEIRVGRTAVLENLNSKYVETARAKGVSERKIVWKHVGRNAAIPLLPVIMGEFYLLIGGSVLVERVFGINGLGNLLISAAFNTDIPVVGATTFIFIVVLVLFNTLQDILYTVLDPRIGFQAGE
jgi:peptide/nickel transport system permease protein